MQAGLIKQEGSRGVKFPPLGERDGHRAGLKDSLNPSLPGFPQSLPPVLSELRLCDERGCFGRGFWLDTWSM